MAYIDTLKSTTALTPTHHKGGGFKMVLAIAVAVAIPVVAPSIATSIGLSGAIGAAVGSTTVGSVLGGALVGAGMGALGSYAMGGDPLMGALGGGIGGGVGGYFQAPTSATTPGVSAFGPGGEGGANFVNATGAPAASPAGIVSQPTIQYDGFGNMVGSPQFDPVSAGVDPGAVLTGGSGGNAVGGGGVDDLSSLGEAVQPSADELAMTARESYDPVATASRIGRPQSLAEKFTSGVQRLGSRIGDKLTSPDFLTEQGIKLGANVLTNQLTGNSPRMSDRERMLMEQQDAALAQIREQEGARVAAQQAGAEALQRQASYFDPNVMGAQASYDTINRMRRAEQERLRGISRTQGGLRTAEQRRSNLDVARLGGTAFNQGYQRGVDAQSKYVGAGLKALPSPSTAYSTALAGQQNGAANYYGRLEQERKSTSGYVQDMLSVFDTRRADDNEAQRGTI